MAFRSRYFFLLLLWVFAGACSKKDNPLTSEDESKPVNVSCLDFTNCVNSPPLSVHPAMTVSAFPTMASRLPGLKNDLDLLASSQTAYPLDIPNNPNNLSKFFGSVFGGKNSEDVKRFLDLRVRYLIPHDVNAFAISYSDREAIPGAATGASVLGKNSGLLLWLSSVAWRENVYSFIGSSKISIDSARVGLIQLGDGFWTYGDQGAGQNLQKVSVARLATLIHEGRHSDCTGGFSPSLIDAFSSVLSAGGNDPFASLVGNTRCGHLHATCPDDHPSSELRGKAACDSSPWGAYAIETVFAQAVATECSSCSLLERQVALLSAVDSKSRLIPISNDPQIDHFERMLSGVLGNPDMSSGGVE